ncbi:peptidoglycan/xylan/chitin deacetylase, PgdA/CDA1 family [Terrimicrobium sacchariphilum]|uniref:Peptidoglycan/xylan/chitin deacetylase, PgdA/CDA1 family n=1 Tax=Terrimicrobium sacchariphilum TaxID=690879 RepID=A0A146G7W9_TERSA|nr:DUF2334 domain-containing protein [Terrimicrobium sacchariphilum]GAT32977.1 peptidoglycan/xylan/chitin deacetylase, PgdA/CDA1 family [Terrimicrobium sacchariphilum]
MKRLAVVGVGVLFVLAGGLIAGNIENPGFESGLEKWDVQGAPGAAFETLKEAASIGELGLRVKVISTPAAGMMTSSQLPVEPGKSYRLAYWFGGGGPTPAVASIEIVFFDEKGAALPAPQSPAGKKARTVATGSSSWAGYELAAIAPVGAKTAAVCIKPMNGQGGAVDFDDIRLEEMPAQSTGSTPPPLDSPRIQELKDEIQKNPTRGKQPPKVVIKLDDLKPAQGGGISPQWQRVVDYARAKNAKLSIGIIAQFMESGNAEFFKWVQDLNAAGSVEFWHHGWDHAAEGNLKEFSGQPYERQKDHMTRANALAKEKLGFVFTSFGAPFNATDASTVKVLSEDSDITVWIYGDPRNPAGKTVLPPSPVMIETRGRPDFEAFLEAYAHNRGIGSFAMQGHAGGWKDDAFDQFRAMVDFLQSQNAEFVFPRDFAGKD